MSDQPNTTLPTTTPNTTIENQWIMQCWDGCALTFWEAEDDAISAFRGHRAVGHRSVLFAPGIVDPNQFKHSGFVTAVKL